MGKTQLPVSQYHTIHCCFPMPSSSPPHLCLTPTLVPCSAFFQVSVLTRLHSLLPLFTLSPFSPHFTLSCYFCYNHYSKKLCSGFLLLFPTPGFASFFAALSLAADFGVTSFPPLLSPRSEHANAPRRGSLTAQGVTQPRLPLHRHRQAKQGSTLKREPPIPV